MKGISTSLAIAAVVSLWTACGAPGEAPGVGSTQSDLREQREVREERENRAEREERDGDRGDGCNRQVEFEGQSPRIQAELNIARRSVCKFRRLEAALDAGYVNTGLPCIPGQGYHYIKPELVGTTNIREPSVLMYDGQGNLNSPEWVAPLDGFPTPPSIFGQNMHADDDLALWILHVWVSKLNPAGVFEDINPNVTCP